MDQHQNHYQYLGIDLHASTDELEEAIERRAKQANALTDTAPERAQEIRDRVRQIRSDLLTSPERRQAYNLGVRQAQRDAARGRAIPLRPEQPAPTPPHEEPAPRPRYQQPEETARIPLPESWRQQTRPSVPREPYAQPSRPATEHTPPWPPPDQTEQQRYGSAAAPPTPPDERGQEPRRLRGIGWTALVLVILAASGGAGFAFFQHLHPLHASAPTATATPTATIPPTPNLTATAASNLHAIGQTLPLRNDLWDQSLECACDKGLSDTEMASALANDQQDLQALRANNEYWQIANATWHLNWKKVHVNTGTAQVYISDNRQLFQNGSPVRHCDGGFLQQFHLVNQGGVWKVDSRQTLGPGQYCQATLPTATLVPPTIGPTPTPPPPPTPIPSPTAGPQQDVEAAVARFSLALMLVARTSNCLPMYAVATDPELSEERHICQMDRQTDAHKEITDLEPPVPESIQVSADGTTATMTVYKHQRILFVYNPCGVPDDINRCGHSGRPNTRRDTRYVAIYYLTKSPGGAWLVYQDHVLRTITR